jgi:putative oxidoreductase
VKRALGAFLIFVILSEATRSRRIPPRHEKICAGSVGSSRTAVCPRDGDVLHRELISRLDSFSISRVLKFLGKYREAGLLLLRASVGLIFILICAPVLLFGEHRWWQFGSAMRVFNFHSHLDWWGFLGALAGCVGGIFMMLGFAFRIGILLAFLVALVNAIAVAHHEHGLYSIIIPIEAVIVLVCLSFIGPGKYSVDKS